MDLLHTFFVFNLTATIAVLFAFFFMRDSATVTASNIGKRLSNFNVAGATGAATSLVLLASIATLFR